jgi:hypothetical protein
MQTAIRTDWDDLRTPDDDSCPTAPVDDIATLWLDIGDGD